MSISAHHSIAAYTEQSLARSLGGLAFLWLEITQHCNLMCRHCYTNSSPARPHNDIDWRSLIDQAHALGCRQLQFIGGEPTSHPLLPEYIRRADALGYDFIEVYTNLSLLTDEVCDVFDDCGVNIATSFYSTQQHVHDRLTGVAGSFDSTLRGMRKIVGRKLPFRVGVVMVGTDDEGPDRKLEFLRGLGVAPDGIRVDHVRPVGRGAKMTPFESLQKTLCGACWQGKLAVSYDGNCYPCVFSRHLTIGNIKTQSVAEIVGSQKLRGFRESMFEEMQTAAQYIPDGNPTPDCLPSDPPCNPRDQCMPLPPPCSPDSSPPGPCDPNCTPNPV